MTDPTLSVIAPCRNEAANIAALAARTLAALDQAGIAGELILIDDGSTDATWSEIESQERRDGRVRGVRHETNLGIEAAWRSGLQEARGRLACLIDSDLQNRPEDIPRLYAAFVKGEGAVIQAVRHAASTMHRHRLFTRGLNGLLNLLCNTRLRDHKSGFILCERQTLAEVLHHRFRYRYYQAMIGAAAAARGYSIAEVDTDFDPRLHGESFLPRFPIRASVRIVWELLKFRVELWTERPRANPSRALEPMLDPRLARSVGQPS